MDDLGPDEAVAGALRGGDEAAFTRLVRSWSPGLLRTALALAGERSEAQEAVRRAWLRVPSEVQGYRPPPGLWIWMCELLLAELAVGTEGRPGQPFFDDPVRAATVDGSRFRPPSDPEWPGHWQVPPIVWPAMEDARPGGHGVGEALRAALEELPAAQRVVVGLRDVAGCQVADITAIVRQPPEQVRALLHQGRAGLRRRLEVHFAQTQST